MRELTWQEKLIDSQYDNAISKWGNSFESLLRQLPKIENLYLITLERGEQFKVTTLEFSEDGTPRIEFKMTNPNLPELVNKPMKVFEKLLEENGLIYDISEFDEERLSIIVDEHI